MKTVIVTFICPLSNEVKAVEFENVTAEFDIKAAVKSKYGPAIILDVETFNQSFQYFQA